MSMNPKLFNTTTLRKSRAPRRGYSIMEVLIAVAVVSLVVSLGAPAVLESQKSRRLQGATETVFFFFQQARSDAIRLNTDVTIDIVAGANWCVGLNDSGDCDCSAANSCTIDNVQTVVSSTDFPTISLQNPVFDGGSQSGFDGTRGLSQGNTGSLELTNGTQTSRLSVNLVGRPSICSVAGDIGRYSAC